jgi:hypothetical protein
MPYTGGPVVVAALPVLDGLDVAGETAALVEGGDDLPIHLDDEVEAPVGTSLGLRPATSPARCALRRTIPLRQELGGAAPHDATS